MKSKSFLFILSAFATATFALAEPSGSDSNAIVPPSMYRDLAPAESKTRYYVLNIRRNYGFVRVRPRVKDNR